MSYCTPCPPCDTEYPLLCEPLETTANGKRLVVEDSAACQKTIQTPVAQQVLKTDGAGNLTWTNGASGTVLRKDSTGLVEFATINSVLQSGPVDLGSQPLTTTGAVSIGTVNAVNVNTTGAIISNANIVTSAGISCQYLNSGAAQFAGLTETSFFNNSVDEHTYIRGGKNTSNVYLNDTSTGFTFVGSGGLIVNGTIESNSTILANGNSSKIGYDTGAGGSATQGAGAKTNSVTLNRPTGIIVTDSAALAANTAVTFNLSNSVIEATDIVVVSHISGGTLGSYNFAVAPAAGNANIVIRNITAGSLSEALTLRFIVIKSVNA